MPGRHSKGCQEIFKDVSLELRKRILLIDTIWELPTDGLKV